MTTQHELHYRPSNSRLLVAGPRLTIQLPAEHTEHLQDLWHLAAEASSIEDLLEWLVDRGFRSFASLVAVEFDEHGPVRVLLRGDAVLHVTDRAGSSRRLSGAERRTWLDTSISNVGMVSTLPADSPHDGLVLVHGVVLAEGFAWTFAAAATASGQPVGAAVPAPPTETEQAPATPESGPPDSDASPEQPAVSDRSHDRWDGADRTIDPLARASMAAALIDSPDLPAGTTGSGNEFDQGSGPARDDEETADPPSPRTEGDEGRTMTTSELLRLRGSLAGATPAPDVPGSNRVRAVVCANGHPNPPNDAVCRVCGTSLASAALQTVPRPIIGYLAFEEGPRVPLEGIIIVGRAPKAPMTPRSEIPALVSVRSPEHGVSRSHVEIRIEGWSASVVDLGSTNGTEVTLPGEAPRRLRRGEPCLITPGTLVRLGDEVAATYEVTS